MTAGIHESLSCEEEIVEQLVESQRHAADYLSRDGRIAADELFFAEQNARGQERRTLLPRDVSRTAQHLESARHTHGRYAG